MDPLSNNMLYGLQSYGRAIQLLTMPEGNHSHGTPRDCLTRIQSTDGNLLIDLK